MGRSTVRSCCSGMVGGESDGNGFKKGQTRRREIMSINNPLRFAVRGAKKWNCS